MKLFTTFCGPYLIGRGSFSWMVIFIQNGWVFPNTTKARAPLIGPHHVDKNHEGHVTKKKYQIYAPGTFEPAQWAVVVGRTVWFLRGPRQSETSVVGVWGIVIHSKSCTKCLHFFHLVGGPWALWELQVPLCNEDVFWRSGTHHSTSLKDPHAYF